MILINLLDIYTYIIFIRVILSWIRIDPYNPVVKLIYQVTEPLLSRLRAVLSFGNMGLDFSPILALLIIRLLRSVIYNMLI